MALSHLSHLPKETLARRNLLRDIDPAELEIITRQIQSRLGSPLTCMNKHMTWKRDFSRERIGYDPNRALYGALSPGP